MEQAAIKQDEKIGRGFVLSILLHVVLAAIFLLRPLMMPPQAPAEENVNVELVPQPQEQQENATKPKEASGQVPTPTPKPDEKTQQAEAQKQPEQKPGDPKAQSDQQDKAQGEKADAAANEQNSSTPTSKPEQQVPTEEIPLPEMKGNEKDPSTTQQADASAQTNATPTPNDNQAEDQATASPAKEPDVQPEQQASSAQSERDTQANQAKAASPVADPDSRDPASMPKPKELATDQPSDAQVAEPEAPATEQDGMDTQEKAAATSIPRRSGRMPPILTRNSSRRPLTTRLLSKSPYRLLPVLNRSSRKTSRLLRTIKAIQRMGRPLSPNPMPNDNSKLPRASRVERWDNSRRPRNSIPAAKWPSCPKANTTLGNNCRGAIAFGLFVAARRWHNLAIILTLLSLLPC